MSEHQADADQLAGRHAWLLAVDGPPVGDEAQALRLLARVEADADAALATAMENGRDVEPDEVADQVRRRAYVWVRLAQDRPEFEQAATAAVRAWDTAQAAATLSTLRAAAR
jgi:hypothetical protein